MEDDRPPLEEHIKEVYAQAGLALYLAQCLEMSLANFLFIFHRATNTSVTLKDLLEVEESNSRKTLGALLKRAKEFCNFDQDAIERLDEALAFRNKLAHHFFKDHGEGFLSFSGREKMLDTLAEMQRSFQIADTLMEAVNRAMSKAVGVTDEILQQELDKIYARSADA
jgi:hypothetical protein